MKKKTGFIAVLALGLAGAAAAMSFGVGTSPDNEETAQATYNPVIAVSTIRPHTGDLSRTGRFIGRVEPGQQVAVIPRTSGEVKSVYYSVGDRVEKGALLFELDTTDIQLQVDIAEAAFAAAEAQVSLSQDSGVDAQLMQLEVGYNQAKLAYENAVKLADMSEDITDDQLGTLSETYRSLNNQIAAYSEQRAQAQAQLALLKEALEADPSDPDIPGEIAKLETSIATLNAAIAAAQSGLTSASSGYDQINDSRKLSRAQTNAQIAQALAAMEAAEEALNLAKEKSIPQGKTVAQANMEQAQASLTAARRQLEYARVTAPIGGVIEMSGVKVYGFATTGNPAYIISNKDMVVISFAVPESVLYNLSVGDSVSIERGGQTAVGEITELATMVNSTGGLFTVKASLPNGAMNLLTGTTVSLEVETARAESAMLLPLDCIYYDNNAPFVYTVENGLAKKTPVVIGLRDNDFAEILAGVSQSDDVVATWHSRLTDGAELSVMEA